MPGCAGVSEEQLAAMFDSFFQSVRGNRSPELRVLLSQMARSAAGTTSVQVLHRQAQS